MIKEYHNLTAREIAAGVKSRKFRAVEICRTALEKAFSAGKNLNAFITVTAELAQRQAEAIDARVISGEPVGPLAGVPVALKDNICLTGYPTTCASHILDGFTPPYDATCARRLCNAGAVIIGKTNMDEFAMGSSNENSYYGPCANPIREDLVPGGSSGGSAATVAARIAPLAYGSETGGSVRQPASFCGLYGLKPTYGGISRYGLVAFASSMDQIGPLARNTEDLALAYQTVCGRDEHDSTSVAFEHPDYLNLTSVERKFRFGLPMEFLGEGVDRDVKQNIETAIEQLRKRGHEIINISLPHSPLAIAVYYVIADAEASSNLARFDGVRYGLREEAEELEEMYRRTRSQGFGAEVKRRIMLGTYVLSAGYYDAYYYKAQQVRELIRRDFEQAFQKVDLLITPTAPTVAFSRGDKVSDPLAMYLSDIFTAPANLAGIPALSAPCGFTSEKLPVGLQFIGPPFGEAMLFQASYALEMILKENAVL